VKVDPVRAAIAKFGPDMVVQVRRGFDPRYRARAKKKIRNYDPAARDVDVVGLARRLETNAEIEVHRRDVLLERCVERVRTIPLESVPRRTKPGCRMRFIRGKSVAISPFAGGSALGGSFTFTRAPLKLTGRQVRKRRVAYDRAATNYQQIATMREAVDREMANQVREKMAEATGAVERDIDSETAGL
jgi:hypothetical protein